MQSSTNDQSQSAPLLPTYEVRVPPQAERAKAVSFLDQKDLHKRRFAILNDALFFGIPGVAISRQTTLGFFGPAGGYVIRGFGRSSESIYVDGIPSQVTNHFHPIGSQYTPDMIDRVEIDRSPTGVMDGPNAVGSIHIFTPPVPRKGVDGYVQGTLGSFNTQFVNGRAGTGWGSGGATLGGEYRRSDGFRNQGFDSWIVNGKLTQDLSKLWSSELRFSYGRAVRDQTYPVGHVQGPGQFCFCTTSAVASFDRTTEQSTSTIAVYLNDTRFVTVRDNTGAYINQQTNEEREYGLRLKQNWTDLYPGNNLTVGADAVRYDGQKPVKLSAHFFSPYVQDSQTLHPIKDQKTVVSAGVRGTFSPDFSTNISPEFGVIQHVDSTLALRLNVSQGFQIPRYSELAANPGRNQVAASPGLKPSSVYDEEIGLNKVFRIGSRKAVFDIDAFLQQASNVLISVPINATQTQVQNSGSFHDKGIEASFDSMLTPALSLHLAETYMVLEKNPSLNAATPRETADIGFDYQKNRWRFVWQSRYASQIYVGNDNSNPMNRLDNYFVSSTKLAYALTPQLAISLDVENVTNAHYATFRRTFPEPGRSYYLSVRYEKGGH